MAVILNRSNKHAKELIDEGRIVLDERDAWSEHRPSPPQGNAFIQLHGFAEYGKWHLGINNEKPEDTKGHYEFPYGDFKNVHRCGLLAAESRAGQYRHYDIENAPAHLHGMLDARKECRAGSQSTHDNSSGRTARGGRAITDRHAQRLTTQKTRLNTTLRRKQVISGKYIVTFLPLDHNVAGEPSQPDPAQQGPKQAGHQEHEAQHDQKARHRVDPRILRVNFPGVGRTIAAAS